MQDIRTLGRLPRESQTDDVDDHEYRLANALRKARKSGSLSAEQEAELETWQKAAKDAATAADLERLKDDIRALGRHPTRSSKDDKERSIYWRLQKARQAGTLTREDEAELLAAE